jgi:hypothetical protein
LHSFSFWPSSTIDSIFCCSQKDLLKVVRAHSSAQFTVTAQSIHIFSVYKLQIVFFFVCSLLL